MLYNTADFIVVDHANHFTCTSLTHPDKMLACNYWKSTTFRTVARLWLLQPQGKNRKVVKVADKDVEVTLRELKNIAEFWNIAEAKVRSFEAAMEENETVAIYGAGFYSAFITACLRCPERIRCFVDQNPFLQGKQLNGKPILAPTDLPEDVRTLMVGLNPKYASEIIADITVLKQRDLRHFYL